MLRYIDLFSGCGGLSLGLHKAGLKGLFAIEKNEDAFATLNENLIKKASHFDWPSWLKIKNYDLNDILAKEELNDLGSKVDLVVGGPPCQGFSLAGKRRKADERNSMSELYIKFIKKVKPKYVFIENVVGFTIPFDNKSSSTSIKIENKLKKMGYNFKSDIIDMSDYGVPQKRKRYIGFGILSSDENNFFDILLRNSNKFLDNYNLKNKQTVYDAIGDLLSSYGNIEKQGQNKFKFGVYGPINSEYQKLMRRDILNEFPDSHRFVNHNKKTIINFKIIHDNVPNGTRLTPDNAYSIDLKKRNLSILSKNKPSGTITSIPDDYLHFEEPRVLTVREMARLQSFPDYFVFMGKYTTGGKLRKIDVPRYTQVANAVPPLFAEQVGLAIKEISLNG